MSALVHEALGDCPEGRLRRRPDSEATSSARVDQRALNDETSQRRTSRPPAGDRGVFGSIGTTLSQTPRSQQSTKAGPLLRLRRRAI